MITVSMAYAVLVIAALAVLPACGWCLRRRSHRNLRARRYPFGPGTANRVPGQVLHAVEVALKRVAPVVSQYDVRIDVAVLPSVAAGVRDNLLIDVIEDMLIVAIHSAPACRLLLTAVAEADQVEVTVTDDLPNADQAYRLGQARGLQERVAMMGGTLSLSTHSAEGAALSVRLASPPMPLTSSPAPAGRFRSHGVVGASG